MSILVKVSQNFGTSTGAEITNRVKVSQSVDRMLLKPLKSIYLYIFFLFAAERGCFKCGALDHIAKDCTGQQAPKYILKEDNRQHGGYSDSRFVKSIAYSNEIPLLFLMVLRLLQV